MKRDNKLDYLRSISAILVIIIHIANYYCRAYQDISHISYLISLIFNALARVSIPIFFMISGCTLLNKDYEKIKNRKRIINKVISLIFITIVYFFWDKYYMNKDISLSLSLIFKPERSLLWFMYVIIAIYIALPFIKCMTDNMDSEKDKLFIILWAIINGLNLKMSYPIPIINGTYYLGYFIIGHIIYKNINKIDIKKYKYILIPLFIVSISVIVILSYNTSLVKNTYYDKFLAYRLLPMIIASTSAFLLLYTYFPNKENKIISSISNLSFGIYLFHGIILDFTMKMIPYKTILSIYGIPLSLIIIFTITYILVFILKKIPVLKKYI